MGKKFGELERVTGVTFFRLSPYEQSPFAGIGEGLGRFIRRCRSYVLRIGPFFLSTYLIMEWATEENYKLHRKNPKDYENDT
ncbi:Cytochrome b-c1 complex subunit 8 [Melipona quadrifasciata]|uniref:Cytochrome b-c1 complex subunit 8 n=1 Tax=Melipona quadrifasciata TaxID=166423 RepID=A0A0N0BFS0_9HYME|nr:Cytochrome b-c1 complex subunit 8 [Melipona quadrifasciata]